MKPQKSSNLKRLHKMALAAYGKAYAPYSQFRVGVALIGGSGKLYSGCNVENSSYGATLCAERAALASAVTNGETSVKAVMIISGLKEGCPPCGICRQCLAEFTLATKGLEVILATPKKVLCSIPIDELLPFAFARSHLSNRK
jgi:cytidine deaminase